MLEPQRAVLTRRRLIATGSARREERCYFLLRGILSSASASAPRRGTADAVPRRGFASLQDTNVAKMRAEAAALVIALDEDDVGSFTRREIVGGNAEMERGDGGGSEWPGFEAGGREGGIRRGGGGPRKSHTRGGCKTTPTASSCRNKL
jgi:hypothetical protein